MFHCREVMYMYLGEYMYTVSLHCILQRNPSNTDMLGGKKVS